jgi:hypothetical protein
MLSGTNRTSGARFVLPDEGQTYAGSLEKGIGTAACTTEASASAGAGTRAKAQRAIEEPMIWKQTNADERGRLIKKRVSENQVFNSQSSNAAEAGSTPGHSMAASIDARYDPVNAQPGPRVRAMINTRSP